MLNFTREEIETGRKLFQKGVEYVLSVADLTQLPPHHELDEIAFAGRSNVGKSSLINALAEKKKLARVSRVPGRTQQLNFYKLWDKLYMVDMPGYGFAQAPESTVRHWQIMVHNYLRGRPNLKRVFLLVDARTGVKKLDKEMMAMMDKAAVNYQLVLTKAERMPTVELAKQINNIAMTLSEHPAAHVDIIATSAEAGYGLEELRAEIARIANVTRVRR
ncbi:MAG: YihA family ribosome biogenesis GTP-binding protein [Alphaproteobacteria bacterium]|nr:YihA family ribosome biogenesis GTP-binding protein [Alphaproteobacteria bacterium]